MKSDSETPKYIRLSRTTRELVVNDPYTDPEEEAERSSRAAKLLRPKSNSVPVARKSMK